MRFTENAMKAIQEAAEVFVTETFHKADLARCVLYPSMPSNTYKYD